MKNIHLICNAHLDPVWLWRWQEGCTEALSTFRTAEKLTDEFPGFVFNHNEAILYQWVKENEPALFERIQRKVREGKWKIMGGWYLQPDCNMPSGESIIRNISEGRRFFEKEFGVRPTTAINFDSFGHSIGLVQILNRAGYDSYVVCRPAKDNFDFKEQDYRWKGLCGSEVLVHRSDENYNSVYGHAAKELEKFLDETQDEPVSLFLWGVGDHGGGPSRKDLQDLTELIAKKAEEYHIFHSGTEAYFAERRQKEEAYPVVERSLNPVAEGCYTSQIRIKQKHRLLENEIYSAEKMASAAAWLLEKEYPKETFAEAVKALLFSEFHDALPGSGTQLVEEDTLRLLDHGLELMSREKLKAAIALTAGEEPLKKGSSCAFFYNPHPYPVKGQFAFEVGLPTQNWDPCFYYPDAFCNGRPVPTQSEMESSHFCIDWRKKVVIEAELLPGNNRIDVFFKPIEKRPVFAPIDGYREWVFDNGRMQVTVNTRTGLVDSWRVDGKEFLKKGSFCPVAYDGTYNSWGLWNGKNAGMQRRFSLLTAHEGSEFSGLSDQVAPSVRVIEDGPVRTVVEALFGWHNSRLYQRYILPKKGTSMELELGVYWNENDMVLKLEMPTALEHADYYGQVMFGREKLRQGGQETVAQKWNALTDGRHALAVLNRGSHASSVDEGVIGLTLLHSAGYSAADGNFEKTLHEIRHTARMEQGERLFCFQLEAGEAALLETLDRDALVYNEEPYAFAFNPSGDGGKKGPAVLLDNEQVLLSAVKKAGEGENYVLRLFESAGRENSARLRLPWANMEYEAKLKPFEIKTLRFDAAEGTISETDILE
ncbi:MAG: glycoside hydrolase family 38 C-terminal domain-containing protein [Eubacteriales bacterium]|nr:glycoside hydrolase family 38 C-terminal domain-containing protein [Eubacteriales bacterium]